MHPPTPQTLTQSAPVVVRIATRKSRLALWQAHHVQARLVGLGAQVSILGMTTQGDQILDRPLAQVGGKGLFVKELEQALLDGRADIAVHSLKDVPMDFPEGLMLAAVVEREDPRDAWVSNTYASLEAVPARAIIGTASMRRRMLIQALRPDLRVLPLRGNLDTRLKKLDHGEYAGIILAVAGLKRLGLEPRIRHIFEPATFLPAPGQGALGIETAVAQGGNSAVHQLLQHLHHPATALRVQAERALSRALGGSCTLPLAGFADWLDETQGLLRLRAIWGEEQGERLTIHRASLAATVRTTAQAEALGVVVAQALRQQA